MGCKYTIQRLSKRSAFTLIELLSVVAIVAILLGILIPAVGKVREQGNSATCVSNLRSLYVPFNMYAQDGHHWPSVNLNSEANVSAKGNQLWFVALMRLGYLEVFQETIEGRDCLNSDILACPSNDVLETRPYLWTGAPYPIYPDYALNVFWGVGEGTVETAQRVPAIAVTNPQAILLVDSKINGSRSIYATDPDHIRWDSANCKIPTDIHNDGAHILRADGSVGSISPSTHPDIEDPKYWNPRY